MRSHRSPGSRALLSFRPRTLRRRVSRAGAQGVLAVWREHIHRLESSVLLTPSRSVVAPAAGELADMKPAEQERQDSTPGFSSSAPPPCSSPNSTVGSGLGERVSSIRFGRIQSHAPIIEIAKAPLARPEVQCPRRCAPAPPWPGAARSLNEVSLDRTAVSNCGNLATNFDKLVSRSGEILWFAIGPSEPRPHRIALPRTFPMT